MPRLLRVRAASPININETSSAEFDPANLLSIEEVAARLKTDVPWVREKCCRRCPNPIPVYNVGRHLLFHWVDVCNWIRNSERPIHAYHRRRKKAA
jgi:hypothetical protein